MRLILNILIYPPNRIQTFLKIDTRIFQNRILILWKKKVVNDEKMILSLEFGFAQGSHHRISL